MRCPACGHMPGEDAGPRQLTREEQLLGYAVELTRASIAPGQDNAEVCARLRAIYETLKTIEHGPQQRADG